MSELLDKIVAFSITILFLAITIMILVIAFKVATGEMPIQTNRVNAELTIHQK